MQSMDPKNSAIISKRKNHRDTRRRWTFRLLRKEFRKTYCTEIPSSSSDGTKNICQYSDSLMTIDFSHKTTRKERQRYENNYILDVSDQGPKPGPMKKRTDYPHAVYKLLTLRKQVGDPNSHIPKHLRFRQRPTEKRERLEQQWKRWEWNRWSQSSSSSTTGGRHKNDKDERRIYFLSRCRKNHSVFFQIVSLRDNSDSFVSDGRCKQLTAPRASITCHTRNVSRRVHVAQKWSRYSVECSLCVS